MADDGSGRRAGLVVPFVPRLGRTATKECEDHPLPELWRRFWLVKGPALANPNTAKNYRRCQELSAPLGDRPDLQAVELWAARLMETHPGSAYLHACILSGVYDLALRRGWTPADPVAEVRAAMKAPRHRSHPIRNIREVWPALLSVCRSPTEAAWLGVYRFAALRPEEGAALTPEDVLTGRDPWELSVNKQRVRWSSFETKAPKSARGTRLVPVRPELRALLAPVLAGWQPVQLRFGTRGMPRGRAECRALFPVRAREERDIRGRLGAVAPEHFGPGHGLHTFRHTCAYELYAAGVDVVTISDWLGHESVKTTETYLSRMVGQRARHDPKLGQFFGGRP